MSFRIEHRLGVPVPALQVWEILKDIERWPEWNSLYPKVEGGLRIGGIVAVTEQLDGAPPQELKATILDWVPEAQILWKSSSSRGWIKRTRYFELDTLTDDGCIFSNGEIYNGFMTRYVDRARRRAIRQSFEGFGEALKARVMASL